jgi:hypothetical protein
MLSNAVVTSGGGVAAAPPATIEVTQVPIVAMSALTVDSSDFAAHAWTSGPTVAAVEASTFGHVGASLSRNSPQKPSSPAAAD